MFTLFSILVGLECAVIAVLFLLAYAIGLVWFALACPLWGFPFLAFNLLCWVRGSKRLHGWLISRWGEQNFPKEVRSRQNRPTALD